MKKLKAKEYLEQISYYKVMLDIKLDELKEQRETIESVKGMKISERVQTSPSNDSMDNIIIRLDKISKEIENTISDMLDKKDKVVAVISKIDNLKYREVLYRRYSLCQSWETISEKMHYSIRQAQRLNGFALQEVERIIKDVA